jgi:hypothetical protein
MITIPQGPPIHTPYNAEACDLWPLALYQQVCVEKKKEKKKN